MSLSGGWTRSGAARVSSAARRTNRYLDSARGRVSRRRAIGNLHAVLGASDHRIVLVDYFGTVVTRTVPPWYVKLLAGQRLIARLGVDLDPADLYRARLDLERQLCRRALDQGRDSDFKLDDLAPELMNVVAQSSSGALGALPSVDEFTTLMIDAEVESELHVQRIDDELVRALRQRQHPSELVLVSDFYLPQPHFARLLEFHALTDLFDEVFVSCDHGRTKKSGALFELLTERFGMEPSEVLVVGDDPVSDGQRARALGMQSYLIPRGGWERRKNAGADEVAKDVERRLDRVLRPVGHDDLFVAMALTLYAFVRRLHRRLGAEDAHEAFFLAREGQLLSRLFMAYEEEEKIPLEGRIPARYLMTSRRATYLPSLPALPHAEFSSLLDGKPGLRVGDFLAMCNLEADTVQRLAADMTGDPSGATPLDLAEVLAHPGFALEYERRRVEQRTALLQYLDQVVGLATSKTVHLVDVGWKGTTQDQLARLLADHDVRLVGSYLGLLVSEPPEPRDPKVGVLFHNQPLRSACLEVFTQFKAMFELLLAADHGSVRAYELGANGAGPMLDEVAAERAEFECHVAPVQAHLERRFRLVCRELARSTVDDDELVHLAARHHARMVFRPSSAEIRFFRQLPVYNAGRRLEWGGRPDPGGWRRLRALRYLVAPRRQVGGGGWPPLRMHAAGAGWLRFPYGWYKLGVHRRRARQLRRGAPASR